MPRRFALHLLLGLLAASRLAHADGDPELAPSLYHCAKKAAKVEVSFKPETDLKELVSWAMGFTCKNFMYDPSYVQRGKKINIATPEEMTQEQAYELFLLALQTMGYTVVAQGNVMRIVESATARSEAIGLYGEAGPLYGQAGGERVVRYLLRPAYAQPQTIAAALATMKSQGGDVEVVGSMLLVTDFASHVRDMLDVVKLIDVPGGGDGIYTIPVLHADAANLAKELEQLLAMPAGSPGPAAAPSAAALSGSGVAATPTKILVDARTNTLLVAASEAGYQRVHALAERLDIPVETESGGQLHIYALKSAIADEVAKTLNAAISGKASMTPAQTAGATTPARVGTAATPASAPAAIDSLALEGTAHVISDQGTNKLIVMSTGHDFVALKHIIDELDEPRREVYIEAVIIDIGTDDISRLGVSSHGTLPTGFGGGGIEIAGVQAADLASTNPATLATATGLGGGILGNAVTAAGATALLGTSFPSYGIAFQALAQINNSTAISAPSIIALDNEEAKYSVGKTIPVKKGTLPLSSTNPTAGLVTTDIEPVDLTLELDIKPHISEGDDVLLEINHTQKEESVPDPVLGPTWTTRAINTRVVAHDQQTVMITGLSQVKETYAKTKVPVLGDLPLIGTLFSYTEKEKIKSNLIILLTPYIIRNRLDIDQIRERHQREEDEFIGSLRALDSAVFQEHVDYTKKRGLVEEINRAVESVDDDARARALLAAPPTVIGGPVTTTIKSP